MIGIDLGTTNSCVGVWKVGKVELATNNMGSRTTPSYVLFKEDEIVTGEAAKLSLKPELCAYDAKRFLGKRFEDASIQKNMKYYSFNLVRDPNGNPKYSIEHRTRTSTFSPIEVSSYILRELYKNAQTLLGDKVEITDVVITVPAYFNTNQKEATMNAAKLANLPRPKLITEPIAAAYAYEYNKTNENKTLLVYDLGGGTFDVSIIKIENDRMEVVGIGGDNELGGRDFDNRLVDYYNEIYRNVKGEEIYNSKRNLCKLRKGCETLKQFLSVQDYSPLCEVSCFEEDFDEDELKMSRAKFELLNEQSFKHTIDIVDKTIKESGLCKDDIDDVLLIGGSSKIPKIKELLRTYFGKDLKCDINGDEAVAIGATLFANKNDRHITNRNVSEILPFSIGISTSRCEFSEIVKKFTKIPTIEPISRKYQTSRDYQDYVDIQILEKDQSGTIIELTTITINPIACKKRGEVTVDVSFKISENGLLEVSAIENCSNKTRKCTVSIQNSLFH